MHLCCPAGHGCNAPEAAERCALDLCYEAAGREHSAVVALERWESFQRACERGGSELRFRRRAYERARDEALIALALIQEPASALRARGPESGIAAGRGIARSASRRGRRGARKIQTGAAGS